jgi:hypothetical protein
MQFFYSNSKYNGFEDFKGTVCLTKSFPNPFPYYSLSLCDFVALSLSLSTPRQGKLLLHSPEEYAIGLMPFEAKFLQCMDNSYDCTGRVSEADMGSFGDVVFSKPMCA